MSKARRLYDDSGVPTKMRLKRGTKLALENKSPGQPNLNHKKNLDGVRLSCNESVIWITNEQLAGVAPKGSQENIIKHHVITLR